MTRAIRSMIGRRTLALSLAASLAGGVALAADLVPGTQLGTSALEIVSALAAQGYEVMEYEHETDEIEVEAVKEGQRLKLEINPTNGEIMKVKARSR